MNTIHFFYLFFVLFYSNSNITLMCPKFGLFYVFFLCRIIFIWFDCNLFVNISSIDIYSNAFTQWARRYIWAIFLYENISINHTVSINPLHHFLLIFSLSSLFLCVTENVWMCGIMVWSQLAANLFHIMLFVTAFSWLDCVVYFKLYVCMCMCVKEMAINWFSQIFRSFS